MSTPWILRSQAVPDAKRLKALEQENTRLKMLLTEALIE